MLSSHWHNATLRNCMQHRQQLMRYEYKELSSERKWVSCVCVPDTRPGSTTVHEDTAAEQEG